MTEFNFEEFFEASVLVREVAERMYSRLEIVTLQPKVILIVENKAGNSEALLKQRYPEAQIVAIEKLQDLAALQNESVDLIFANLILPFSQDLKKTLYEWRRVLRHEGLLMFTSFGPDTLKELNGKIANIPAPTWHDMHNVGDELIQTGWLDPVMDMEYIEVTYRDSERLIHDLLVMQMITQTFDSTQLERNKEGVFSISYEVVYGHAWAPGMSAGFASDEEGVARIPLSHLRRKH